MPRSIADEWYIRLVPLPIDGEIDHTTPSNVGADANVNANDGNSNTIVADEKKKPVSYFKLDTQISPLTPDKTYPAIPAMAATGRGYPAPIEKVFTLRQLLVHSRGGHSDVITSNTTTSPGGLGAGTKLKKHVIEGGVALGRGKYDCLKRDSGSFECPIVSRYHAQLLITTRGSVHIIDLSSHHGTTVRTSTGRTIKVHPSCAVSLAHGDIITLGKTVLDTSKGYILPLKFRIEFRYPELGPATGDSRVSQEDLTNIAARQIYANRGHIALIESKIKGFAEDKRLEEHLGSAFDGDFDASLEMTECDDDSEGDGNDDGNGTDQDDTRSSTGDKFSAVAWDSSGSSWGEGEGEQSPGAFQYQQALDKSTGCSATGSDAAGDPVSEDDLPNTGSPNIVANEYATFAPADKKDEEEHEQEQDITSSQRRGVYGVPPSVLYPTDDDDDEFIREHRSTSIASNMPNSSEGPVDHYSPSPSPYHYRSLPPFLPSRAEQIARAAQGDFFRPADSWIASPYQSPSPTPTPHPQVRTTNCRRTERPDYNPGLVEVKGLVAKVELGSDIVMEAKGASKPGSDVVVGNKGKDIHDSLHGIRSSSPSRSIKAVHVQLRPTIKDVTLRLQKGLIPLPTAEVVQKFMARQLALETRADMAFRHFAGAGMESEQEDRAVAQSVLSKANGNAASGVEDKLSRAAEGVDVEARKTPYVADALKSTEQVFAAKTTRISEDDPIESSQEESFTLKTAAQPRLQTDSHTRPAAKPDEEPISDEALAPAHEREGIVKHEQEEEGDEEADLEQRDDYGKFYSYSDDEDQDLDQDEGASKAEGRDGARVLAGEGGLNSNSLAGQRESATLATRPTIEDDPNLSRSPSPVPSEAASEDESEHSDVDSDDDESFMAKSCSDDESDMGSEDDSCENGSDEEEDRRVYERRCCIIVDADNSEGGEILFSEQELATLALRKTSDAVVWGSTPQGDPALLAERADDTASSGSDASSIGLVTPSTDTTIALPYLESPTKSLKRSREEMEDMDDTMCTHGPNVPHVTSMTNEEPPNKRRTVTSAIGLIILGAALGSVGTIAGLMQIAP